MSIARSLMRYQLLNLNDQPSFETIKKILEDDCFIPSLIRTFVHYAIHQCFLEPNQVLANLSQIIHLPCTIVHGALDVVCPLKQAIVAAQNLKTKAIELGAVEFSGLATEAYRKAPNGQMLVDKYFSELNIPVKIISQLEEGKMGFLALIAQTHLDPYQVISWDIGGGSFQVAYIDEEKNMQVYMAPFGRSTTKNAIIKFVKGEDPSKMASPNPMNICEWENSIKYLNEVLPQVPESLVHKLKMANVQMIGIEAHPEKLRNLKTYHLNDIIELLEESLNKNDSELANMHKSPSFAVTELALIYCIMQKLNIPSVSYIRTSSSSLPR